MNYLCQDVSQGTVGRTVLTLVFTLLMVTDVKNSVTVTRSAVKLLQDVGLRPQVIYYLIIIIFET